MMVTAKSLTVIVLAVYITSLIWTVHGKPDYRVDLESFKVHKHKEFDLLEIQQARLSKFNRTTRVFNATVTLLQDLVPNAMIKLTCFELLKSKKYSMIPVPLYPLTNVCKALKEDRMFMPILRKYIKNCPKECPFLKGDYQILNMLIDSESLPDVMPGDRWRCDIQMYYGALEKFRSSFFIFLNRNF